MGQSDKDIIITKTNGGFDVFVHYMGERCRKRVFCNPFREDSSPSCHLYYHKSSGRFFLKDFGDSSWDGDCFWLVSKITSRDLRTDFADILKVIDRDLELFIINEAPSGWHPSMRKVKPADKPAQSKPIMFAPVYKDFSGKELEYWGRYGIGADILSLYDVRSLQSCQFTREDGSGFMLESSWQYPLFGYVFGGGKGIKTYRPGSNFRFTRAGEVPSPYVFGWDQLPLDGDIVLVTGGEKDVMSFAAHGYHAICLNSETSRVPESMLMRLSERFTHILFSYDSDETGRRESDARVSEYRDKFPVSRLLLPLPGTKQQKDISDFFSSGHTADELGVLIGRAVTGGQQN